MMHDADGVERIEATAQDTLLTLRLRLRELRARPVLLVLPEERELLRHKLDLVLLQREAHRRALQLALVSQDPKLRALAEAMDISCFATVDESRRQSWKRGRQKIFLPRYQKPSPAMAVQDIAYIARRKRGKSALRRIAEQLLLFVALVGGLGGLLLFFLPSAVITLSLQGEPVSITVDVLADSGLQQLQVESGGMPALLLQEAVAGTASIPTSGRKNVASSSAVATVRFTNKGTSPISIPHGTIVRTITSPAVLFATRSDLDLSGGRGATVDGTVRALDDYGGHIGNVAPGSISAVQGELNGRIAVENLEAATGGAERVVHTVARADQVQLRENLRNQLQSLAFERMRASLPADYTIIIESVRIAEEQKGWSEFLAEVGAITEELQLTMRAVVSALALDEALLEQLLRARLQESLPAGMALAGQNLQVKRGIVSVHTAGTQLRFTAAATAQSVPVLDQAQLRERLVNLTVDRALEELGQIPGIAPEPPPQIDTFPSSWQHMPRTALRIDIQLREGK